MPQYKFEEEKAKHHEVRLFPTIGIKTGEAEMRATSALLAMVRAVAEFGGAIIKKAGGPGGKGKNVQCFTEMSFCPDYPDHSKPIRPDGIIRRISAKKPWNALVEVKISDNPIKGEQVDSYLVLASSLKYQVLITISNQIALPNGDPPYKYTHHRTSVKVRHFSWEAIHSIIRMLCTKDKGIVDEDQKWMLEQFDQYLADANSGVIALPTLGDKWSDFLKHSKAQNLNVHTDSLQDVIKHWLAFLRVASMRMEAIIGQDVKVKIPRTFKDNPAGLILHKCQETIDNKCVLTGELDFPDIGGILFRLNLETKELQLSHKINVPKEGGQKKRVRFIVHELKKLGDMVPLHLRIKVGWKNLSLPTAAEYGELRDGSITRLLHDSNSAPIGGDATPKHFQLEHVTLLGKASGAKCVKHLESVFKALNEFYGLMKLIDHTGGKPNPLQADEYSTSEEETVEEQAGSESET